MKIKLATLFYSLILTISLMTTTCGQSSPQVEINCGNLFPPTDTVIETHGEWARIHYPDRIEEFKNDPISTGDIVMIGNSLTEQGGDWSSKLNVPNVKNRGISGDNTDGVMARLDEIICGSPSIIFVMIGTNDLWTNYSAKKISENIDFIGKKLTSALPEARVFIQTIMPLGENQENSPKLNEINRYLLEIQTTPYLLIDTNLQMANANGVLAKDLTTDGVHLTPNAYEKWSSILMPYINHE